MKTYILLYNDFVDFEIAIILALLKKKGTVHTVTIDDEIVPSFGQLKVISDMTPKDVDPRDVDLFLIPGGEPEIYKDRADIHSLLIKLNKLNKPIAAICGGPGFLAHSGIIKGKRITHGYTEEDAKKVFNESKIVDEDVVVDGNIITARGVAYVEFAVSIYRHLGFFNNEDEADETLKWLKNMH